jgi:cytochrome c biogenesis protein CcdA
VATLLAASISVAAFLVLVVVLFVGLGAALLGAAETTSTWLSVLLVVLSVVMIAFLAVCATGLSIIWKHRGDYEAARNSTTGSP